MPINKIDTMKKILMLTTAVMALCWCACNKENEPSGDVDAMKDGIAYTEWEYPKVDTLEASDGTIAVLKNVMGFDFSSESSGTFSMDYILLVNGVEDFSDKESYPMTYTFDRQAHTGSVGVTDREGGATLYSFTLRLVNNDTLDVRMSGSNPMHFVRRK